MSKRMSWLTMCALCAAAGVGLAYAGAQPIWCLVASVAIAVPFTFVPALSGERAKEG